MSIKNFTQLYCSHYSEIFRYCYRLTKSREDAEDVTERAFIKAYYHFDPNKKASFRTFIYLIATNMCKDFIKSRQFQQRAKNIQIDDPNFSEPLQENDFKANDHEILISMHNCLDRLSFEERLSIRLYYIEGFNLQEIADILGKAPNTAKKRIETGIKKLKACLEQ